MEVEELPAFETICMARSLVTTDFVVHLDFDFILACTWPLLVNCFSFTEILFQLFCFFRIVLNLPLLVCYRSCLYFDLHCIFIFYSVSFFYSIPRIVPARELSIFHLMVFQCQSLLKDVHPKNPFRFLSFTGLYYQGVRASFTTV